MEMKVKVFFWFVFLSVAPEFGDAARLSVSRRNLEVKQHLNRLNKPPLKSIKMRPSYHPEGLFSQSEKMGKKEIGPEPITQLWHMKGRCQPGTIPIRRTRKDDVLRASSVQSFGKKKHKSIPRPTSAAPEPDLISQNGHQFFSMP